MKIKAKDFRIVSGRAAGLNTRATLIDPYYSSKKEYKDRLEEWADDIGKEQEAMFAANQYALLVIFQGMDTSGKDGIIGRVFSGVNPLGFQAFSFKQPSAEELDHDFLWRTSKCLPERGRIGVFNRSYYEEVVVVRVHPEFLAGQDIPPKLLNLKKIWPQRYESINAHEAHLVANGTRILKFYLHLSKAEQARRLLARIEEPDKNWKFNPGDMKERQLWLKYREDYEACLTATSTPYAPWYAVPADDKENARLIVASLVRDELRSLKLSYPSAGKAARAEFRAAHAALKSELGDK
jgi:PPK2 family polyphosphate:nucleotide phosphotransferase